MIAYGKQRETDWNKYYRRRTFTLRMFGPSRRYFLRVHKAAIKLLTEDERFKVADGSSNIYRMRRLATHGVAAFAADDQWMNEFISAIIAIIGTAGGGWGPVIAIGIRLALMILMQGLEDYFQQNGEEAFQSQVRAWNQQAVGMADTD